MFAISADRKFEKIFSNYPFGMRLVHLQEGTDYELTYKNNKGKIDIPPSVDNIIRSIP